MYLNVVSGMPSEPTEHVIEVSQKIKLKYPSRVGPMTLAITTVVNNVQTSVIITSKPMKMKFRPTTLALLGTGCDGGMFNVVTPISGSDRYIGSLVHGKHNGKVLGISAHQ
jgi:H+/gluconate symporter-like permease